MRILKNILFGLLAMVGLVLLAALFIKKDFAVERQITINRPINEVFDYVKYVKNQDNFSKWNKIDPQMIKSYEGQDGNVGFVYKWQSENKNVGVGEQEIKGITEGKRIDMELRFKKPFEITDDAYMTTTAIDSTHTQVAWGFNGSMPYPFNAMMLMMNFDKEIGADLDTGLGNLKAVLEK